MWLAIVTASLLPAQEPARPSDPLQAARPRLQAALQKTGAAVDTKFAAAWAENGKKKDDGNQVIFAMGGPGEGKTTGSWHQGLVHVQFDGDTGDELLVAGPRTLAKANDKDWMLRRGRFADGNVVDFVPDPALLLEQLAAWDLAIVQRSVGSLDDRPMEFLTVALSADQVAEAVWCGALPNALLAGSGMNPFAVLIAARNGGARPPAATPTSTVDLAVALDPATGLVHQLQFRSWTKQDQNAMGGRVVMVRAGGGGVQVGGDDEQGDEEGDEKAAAAAAGPIQYENGLPVRPRKKVTVMDFTVRLSEHGKAKFPALTDNQRRLLKL
jgi:hypothetical protein